MAESRRRRPKRLHWSGACSKLTSPNRLHHLPGNLSQYRRRRREIQPREPRVIRAKALAKIQPNLGLIQKELPGGARQFQRPAIEPGQIRRLRHSHRHARKLGGEPRRQFRAMAGTLPETTGDASRQPRSTAFLPEHIRVVGRVTRPPEQRPVHDTIDNIADWLLARRTSRPTALPASTNLLGACSPPKCRCCG